ncbi:aminoglycoside phosphotransferase family protein [Caldiplasma sukawensis]
MIRYFDQKDDEFYIKIAQEYGKFKKFRFDRNGMNNIVLIADERKVFRFPKSKFSIENIEKEKNILDGLVDFPFKIPKYVMHSFQGIPFAEYEYINGVTLSSIREVNESIMNDILKFFKYTTSIRANEFFNISKKEMKQKWLANELKLMYRFKEEISFKKYDDEFDKMIKRMKELIEKSSENSYGFIHGDFYRDNIILKLDLSGFEGIIDWSEAGTGDFAIDLSAISFHTGLERIPDILGKIQISGDAQLMERIMFYRMVEPLYSIFYISRTVSKEKAFEKIKDYMNNFYRQDYL